MGLLDRFRKPPAPARTEKGRSGTVNLRGFLQSEELNRNLVWPRNLDVYDEMRRTDPTIRWMLALAKNPILAAEPEIEPASQEPEDLERAAFVEHALCHELDGGLHSFLREAMLYLDFGHYVFERVADLRDVEFTYDDPEGNETDVAKQMFVVSKLAPRKPRTIQRWVTPDGNPSELQGIEQWLSDPTQDEPNPFIPLARLVIFTNEQEGDDFKGTSLLRAAYSAYRYKVKLENLEAIALERSVGMPVMYAPSATASELADYEELLSNIRQGENLYAVIPKPKYDAQHNPDGVLLEDLAVSGDGSHSRSGQSAAHAAIGRHEAAMARNVLAEFMRLGHEQTGARATGDVQQDPYYQAIEGYARYIEQVVNEQVVAPLVAWNYQGGRLPKLRFSKIQAKNVQVVADALAKGLTGGLIIPDLETENWLRSILDAPRRKPDDGEQDPYKRPSDPPPMDPNKIDPTTGQPFPPPKPPGGQQAALGEFRASPDRHPAEQHVAFAEINTTLDTLQDQLLRSAVDASRDPVAHTLSEAVKADTPAAVDRLDVTGGAIQQAVLGVLEDAYRKGRMTVASELRSQGAAFRFEATVPSPDDRLKRLALAATTIAESIAAQATRAIRAFAIRRLDNPRIAPTTPGHEPDMAVRQAARGGALAHIAAAFNLGRRDEQVHRQAEIAMSVYSAILDTHNCGPCRASDGREGPVGGDPDLPTPNPLCEGGGACRCMWIPVLKTARGAVAYPQGFPDVALPEAA